MIVASRRAASTRIRSHFGSSSAARWQAIVALAFSISASDGSKRVTSWTTMQTLLASLWSTRPRTSTISSAANTPSAAAIAFSKTTTSTVPSRSSTVANIMFEPLRVRIFLASVIMPLTFTHSPSLRSGISAIAQSAFIRSASRTRLSGCSVMKTPIDSFSIASSSGRSYSCVGIGGWLGAVNAFAPPPASSPKPPRSKIDPRSISASCWDFWPAAWAESSTSSMPRDGSPRSSRTRRT